MNEESVWLRRLPRRRLLAGGSAGVLATGLLAACGGSSNSAKPAAAGTGTGASAGAAAGTSAAKRGGKLVYVQNTDVTPASIPYEANPSVTLTYQAIYDRLTALKPGTLEPQPQLATSWEFSPDNMQLTLHLRPGVKFHSGRPFTSADVAFNIDAVKQKENNSQLRIIAASIVKVETPDPQTVVLHFSLPQPTIFDMFEYLVMADKETIASGKQGKGFVGTGPFVWKDWTPNDHLTFERNPNYWQTGLPYVDQITQRVVPDVQTQLIDLQTGSADIANNIEPKTIKQLQADKKYATPPIPANGAWYTGINVKAGPFTDPRVRQAISFLIDRQRFVDAVLFGFGDASDLPWPLDSPANDPTLAKQDAYDPQKAKSLLAAAGVGNGFSTDITVSQLYIPAQQLATLLQQSLTSVGITATITKLEHAQYLPLLVNGGFKGLWTAPVGYNMLHPSTLFQEAFAYRVPNSSNYDTPEYRALAQKLLQAPSDQQKAVTAEMNRFLLDAAFVLPVAAIRLPLVARARVHGISYTVTGALRLELLSVE